jgi:tetratricopeptide (TPR) repeat protein
VLRTLELVRTQLLAPAVSYAITVEALLLEGGTSETWDLAIQPPTSVIEVKANPTAADIRDFVSAARTSRADRIELIYGRAGGALYAALDRLKLFRETSADAEQLMRFVGQAGVREQELARLLADQAFDVLERMTLTNMPENLLNWQIELAAQALVGEHADVLVEMLTTRYSAGSAVRRRYPISELIAELAGRGWALHLPPSGASAGEPRAPARAALLVLQRAAAPVPLEVLSAAAAVGAEPLRDALEALTVGELLQHVDGVWALRELPCEIGDAGQDEVLARALRRLLQWIESNPRHPALEGAVDAAVSLGRETFVSHPEVVAPSFRVLDKLLKRRGDKHLVFEVANRSVAAAGRAAIRSTEMVKAEAVALICGRSWVYQRIGQLGHARADGEHSLQLGEQISWNRNTAFCHKCLGRLCRLDAEFSVEPERAQLLARSDEHLQQAIKHFEALGLPAEVGDAWSLLARTRLSVGDVDGAEAALQEAEQRLVEPAEKDFVDMLIVRGDIAAANSDEARADESYRLAISSGGAGSEFTEMRARALHHRAMLRLKNGRRDDARSDFRRAAETYATLNEPHFVALSELEVMRMDDRLPRRPRNPEVGRLLELEPPLVQVLAVRAHESAVEEQIGNEAALAFRTSSTVAHWRQMIVQARVEAARTDRPW